MSDSVRTAVVGIDVGGSRKGFHAVALEAGRYLARTESRSAEEIREWCRAQDARIVAVDAPCRWRLNGRMRECERALSANAYPATQPRAARTRRRTRSTGGCSTARRSTRFWRPTSRYSTA